MFFNISESLYETLDELFVKKLPEDPNSFYMSKSLSKYENILDIGYINKYYSNKIRDTGAFFIIINSNFSNCIFAISKTNKIESGIINKLCYSGDELNILWEPGEYPFLQFIKSKDKDKYKDVKKLDFYIKVTTSF
jgi:hypothetical protein